MNWKTLLVPTDFSEHSRAALLLARDIAAEQDARLVVVHVVADALPALLPDVAGFRYDEVVEALGQRAQESLPTFFPEDERRGVAVDFRVVFGAPHAEITSLAGELPSDLIVIATHGRSAAMHLLMGSVAEKVVRSAPCPVLVIRRPAGQPH